jgi:hypothetical protein
MGTLRVHMDGAQALELGWSGWDPGWAQSELLQNCMCVLDKVQVDGREAA